MKKNELAKLNISLTKKEKDLILKLARDKGYPTVASYVVRNAINNISINIDTSDYLSLVNQVRDIGINVNTLTKKVLTNKYFGDNEILQFQNHLISVENLLQEHKEKIDSVENVLNNITPLELKSLLENKQLELPDELIFDRTIKQLTDHLMNIIEIMKNNNWEDMYIDYIYNFVFKLLPYNYSYDEFINLEKEFYNEVKRIELKLLKKENEFDKEDFKNIRDLINKYGK